MSNPTADPVSAIRKRAAAQQSRYGFRWNQILRDRRDLLKEVDRLRRLLDLAKDEHYCGNRRPKCGSPFCDGMRAAGEKL